MNIEKEITFSHEYLFILFVSIFQYIYTDHVKLIIEQKFINFLSLSYFIEKKSQNNHKNQRDYS